MRIFSAVLAAGLLAAASGAAAQQPDVRSSAQSALRRGLIAYRAGQQETAIPALTEAAGMGDPSAGFFAEFYLARIYSENVGAAADHTKAYMLFRKLADENLNVDPYRSQRAPFVAKALIALAGYVRAGIKEIGLPANPHRAGDYLNHAAVFFGDKDAQFELARLYLSPGGSADDIKRGLHYLSVLTVAGYPAAQALLAELLWRGQHVKKDDGRALALITLAVEYAPAHERMWIEDSYATIYCAATQATRQEAGRIVARWRKMFTQPSPEPPGLAVRGFLPERQCANGETVAIARAIKAATARTAPPSDLKPVKNGREPFGFRAAGVVKPLVKK